MRVATSRKLLLLLVVILLVSAESAGALDGTVKLGGIILDETGDPSAVQETYNVFDGLSISQIYLRGMSNATDHFTLDLREVNLGSRKGSLLYRRPGVFKINASYDQYRRLFGSDAGVNSKRKDWKVGAQYSPAKWLALSGSFNHLSRDGGRLSYPLETTSVLGTEYDNTLTTRRVAARVQRGRVGGEIAYSVSSFSDEMNDAADRTGRVVSGSFHAPSWFYDRWTNMLRASYGTSELSCDDADRKLMSFQYTGVVAPLHALEFKYIFDATRVDDEGTNLKTDRFQNGADATFFYKFGQVSCGYVYETNDDDRRLTSYHSWRAATVFRYRKYVTARVNYAGRVKKDQEELTLLKDVEATRFRAQLQVQPTDALTFGGSYARREREFPDIQVQSEGEAASGFARYTYPGWGAVSGEYSYAKDTYQGLVAGFDAESDVLTGRVSFTRVEGLQLGGGVTYLNIGGDLDIEKWMVFAEGTYRLPGDYSIEVKYNVYNYDDYILLDRYYTANVLRFNVGYDFSLK